MGGVRKGGEARWGCGRSGAAARYRRLRAVVEAGGAGGGAADVEEERKEGKKASGKKDVEKIRWVLPFAPSHGANVHPIAVPERSGCIGKCKNWSTVHIRRQPIVVFFHHGSNELANQSYLHCMR
jgi:hypothetical protein